MFTKPFGSYVVPGDSITTEDDGYTIKARIEFDQDSNPSDFECYTPEQIKAWQNDEWFFCGVVLSVSRNGVELSDHAASLWGVDANFPGSDNAYLLEVANELLPDALTEARKLHRETVIKLGGTLPDNAG